QTWKYKLFRRGEGELLESEEYFPQGLHQKLNQLSVCRVKKRMPSPQERTGQNNLQQVPGAL
ncbi:MAG TPA: hypothetical protein DGH68_12355, partial [Bacteroidetes bacterium]|nr:hypothetical protein [Bacteroidota bacterium]